MKSAAPKQISSLLNFDLKDFRAALKKELATKIEAGPSTTAAPLVPNFVNRESEVDMSEMQSSFFSKRGSSLQPVQIHENFEPRYANQSQTFNKVSQLREQLVATPERKSELTSRISAISSRLEGNSSQIFDDVNRVKTSIKPHVKRQSSLGHFINPNPSEKFLFTLTRGKEKTEDFESAIPFSKSREQFYKETPLKSDQGLDSVKIRKLRQEIEALDVIGPSKDDLVDELIDLASSIMKKIKSRRL